MKSLFLGTTIFKPLFFIFLLAIFLIGFYNGVISEQGAKDLQYYPSKLLLENVDFYHSYLNSSEWFMSQVPNYYFQLYYIISPISLLGWGNVKLFWYLLNVFLICLFFYDIKKRQGVSFKQLSIYILPFFLGFPMTNTLGNGQFGIIVFITIYFSWILRHNTYILSLLLFILISKYSFGVPIILGFFLMGYYRSVIISISLSLLFSIIYSIQFNLNVFRTIFLPIKINFSSEAIRVGSSDIMSLSKMLFDNELTGQVVISFFLISFITTLFYYTFRRKASDIQLFLSSIVFSLFGFFHLPYDWVVLILILVFLNDGLFTRIFYFIILFLFTLPRIIKLSSFFGFNVDWGQDFVNNPYFILLNLVLLICLFFKILNPSNENKRLFNSL